MKYVYVLTSSIGDFYYEQFYLSAFSLRLHNPGAFIVVLVDSKTKETLTEKRSNYESIVSETITINAHQELSQKEVSRFIKTSMKTYIKGDFLYIDCDTIICQSLNDNFPPEIKIGAVLDTHVPLSKHHHAPNFKIEDTKLGFKSFFETGIRYNGGVIFCRDEPEVDEFFSKWHSLWNFTREKGNSQDMPSFNQANLDMGNIITELNGNWNCQIVFNGLPFLHTAKIIHYIVTVFDFLNCPFLPASKPVLRSVKETGTISNEIYELLKNPKSAFELKSRIISDKEELDVLNSKIFLILLLLRKKKPRLFKAINSFIIRIRHNKLAKKLYHRPKE